MSGTAQDHAAFLSCLEKMTGHVFCRKVGRIKKSLYINIPSKIARMLDITKGSSLHIMVQDGMVILSKDQDDKSRDKLEPILDTKDKQGNDTQVKRAISNEC